MTFNVDGGLDGISEGSMEGAKVEHSTNRRDTVCRGLRALRILILGVLLLAFLSQISNIQRIGLYTGRLRPQITQNILILKRPANF